jgi:hypothetical protein
MIFVGLDDTDVVGSRGTNQVARAIVRHTAQRWTCRWIVRHQLLVDPRIPLTSKNGSASIALKPKGHGGVEELISACRQVMREAFLPGSDPGLCVAEVIPDVVTEFARRCQREVVRQEEAREIAGRSGVHLEGLGGTEGGVIGALAAVGLAATGNDGRIVQWGSWADDLSGIQSVDALERREISIVDVDDQNRISTGLIDVGKHLRPNLRGNRAVLYAARVTSSPDMFVALKMT